MKEVSTPPMGQRRSLYFIIAVKYAGETTAQYTRYTQPKNFRRGMGCERRKKKCGYSSLRTSITGGLGGVHLSTLSTNSNMQCTWAQIECHFSSIPPLHSPVELSYSTSPDTLECVNYCNKEADDGSNVLLCSHDSSTMLLHMQGNSRRLQCACSPVYPSPKILRV